MADDEMKAPHPPWVKGLSLAQDWGTSFKNTLFKPDGWKLAVSIIGAYLAIFALFEARYERQLNRALFSQNRFMTLAASGNPGGLNAALAEYEDLKDMDILDEPFWWRFWKWSATRKENKEVLERWAQKFFNGCPNGTCGMGLDLTVLTKGDLCGADMRGANLQRAILRGADLRNADLRRANFEKADLRGADLHGADLGQNDLDGVFLKLTNLRGAHLRRVKNFPPGRLNKACTDNTTTLPEHLSPMSPEQREECAKLWPLSFKP